jgi:hexosaminidase
MLDVARHFRSVRDVRRFVDLMALYKLNRLHLHLSDDQGWRIAVDKWPRLATHGGSTAVGGGKGGWYTQAQYEDIVRYAAARYVTVVPEIDMPGHVHAALSSYPKLCDGKPSPLYTGITSASARSASRTTYDFVSDVVGSWRG